MIDVDEYLDREFEEEVMEHLAKSITGEKSLKLEIEEAKCSYADLDEKRIVIQENVAEAEDIEMLKRFWRAFNVHESAHISWSGTLKKEYKSWTSSKGDFKDFKDTVNVVEDIRIEDVMVKVLPQTKKYFVEFLEKFVEKRADGGVLKTDNPIMALRLALENKMELPYEVDEDMKPYLKEAIDKFNEMEVLTKDWKNVVKCSEEIHKIFERLRSKHPRFRPDGDLHEDLKDIDERLEENDKEFNDLKKDGEKAREELDEVEELIDDLLEKDKGDGLKGEEADALDDLRKKKEEIEKSIDDIDKKVEENKESYKDLSQERDAKKREIENAKLERSREEIVDGLIRVTDFEDRDEAGRFSDLTAEEIVEVLEKLKHEMDEEQEKSLYESLERDGEFGVPRIEEFDKDVKYSGEDFHKIPEISLALETGDEIASALKRELKLKKSLIKRKTSGKLDMKRIRKQMTYYGEIRDTDIFSRKKKNLTDHSVMVMIDFSGSMSGRKLTTAKQALATFGRALAQLGVNYSLRGYSALGGRMVIGDIVIKEFGKEECDYKFIDKAFYPERARGSGWWGENRDGDSWRLGGELLQQQSGEKLLIVISDGEPCHGGTAYSGRRGKADSKLAIQQVEGMGVKTLGISIDKSANAYIKEAFRNHFFFDGDKLKDLGEGLIEIYIESMNL